MWYQTIKLLILILSGLNAQEQFKIVNFGDSIIFHCNHSKQHLGYLRWMYQPHNSKTNVDLYDLRNDEVIPNYEASCRFDQLFCDFKLLNATEQNAGKYSCWVGNGIKEERLIVTTIVLVVGSLTCKSNIGDDRKMIGENDCKEIQPDILRRTCMFEYYGSLNKEMNFGWTRTTTNKTRFTEDYKIGNNFSSNSIGIQDDLEVNTNMDGMTFQCAVKNLFMLKPCHLPVFTVQRVKSPKTQKSYKLSEFQNTTCSIEKSANITCSCSWVHQSYNKTVQITITGCILVSVKVKYAGLYKCEGKCGIYPSKTCYLKDAMTLDLEGTEKEIGYLKKNHITNVAVFIGSTILIIVIGVIIFVFLRKNIIFQKNNSSLNCNQEIFEKMKNISSEITVFQENDKTNSIETHQPSTISCNENNQTNKIVEKNEDEELFVKATNARNILETVNNFYNDENLIKLEQDDNEHEHEQESFIKKVYKF